MTETKIKSQHGEVLKPGIAYLIPMSSLTQPMLDGIKEIYADIVWGNREFLDRNRFYADELIENLSSGFPTEFRWGAPGFPDAKLHVGKVSSGKGTLLRFFFYPNNPPKSDKDRSRAEKISRTFEEAVYNFARDSRVAEEIPL